MAAGAPAGGPPTTVRAMHLPIAIRLAVALTAVTVGGALLLAGYWKIAIGVALLAGLWTWGHERRSQGLSNAVFVAFLTVTALGVIEDVMLGAMLVGGLFALAAWDLDALAARLDRADHATATDRLLVRHGERLLIALGLGGVLGGTAMVGSLGIGLGGALGLGVVAVMGLRWLLRTTARNLH